MGWINGPLLGFDTETTGVDVERDRIVTAALVYRFAGMTRTKTWLINPGIPIPPEATAVHGITDDEVRRFGLDPAVALEELADIIARFLARGGPLVAFNAAFDLFILEAELARYGLPTLRERLGGPIGPVIDPLVLDRQHDRYRPGKRKLIDLCAVYGVAGEGLHTAEVDVTATLDVLAAMVATFPELALSGLGQLHDAQSGWHRAWAEDFNSWRASKGFDGPGASTVWLLE